METTPKLVRVDGRRTSVRRTGDKRERVASRVEDHPITPESPGQKTVEEWSGGPVREATDGSAPRGTLGDLVYRIDALVKRERAAVLSEAADALAVTWVDDWPDVPQWLRARAAEEER